MDTVRDALSQTMSIYDSFTLKAREKDNTNYFLTMDAPPQATGF